MAVDWRLGLAPDVTGNAFSSFMQGQQAKEGDMAKNAMTAYVTNPNPENLNALAPYQPQLVLQQKQAEQEKARKEAEQKIVGDALSHPDPNVRAQARQQLAYTNSELYLKLDDNGKKAVDTTMKSIGQLAFNIMQLPKEQREPALQQALQGLQAQGIDTSSFHLTGDPDVDLRTALAVSGQLDDFEKFKQPKYVPVGEGGLAGFQYGQPIQQGGQPQNFGPQPAPAQGGEAVVTAEQYRGAVNGLGPQAAAEWAQRNGIKVSVSTPAEATALPPGTHYITPDGREMIR